MTDPRHAYRRPAQRFPVVREYTDAGLVRASIFTVFFAFLRGIGYGLARQLFRRG
jgi:hypothetical protein